MKKTLAFLAALAVSLLSLNAQVQEDKQVFNHAALGVSAGIDGLGVEAVLPATPFLQIRGGYSFFPYTYKKTLDLGSFQLDDGTHSLDLSNVPFSAAIWKGGLGKVLLDIYPGKTLPFRFVAGVFIGSGKLVGCTADLTHVKVNNQTMTEEDYETGFGYHGISFSTDKTGKAYADAAVLKVLPYLGLGFGRPLSPQKRVAFSFELGVIYTGGIKFQTYDFSNPSKTEVSVVTSQALVDNNGKKLDDGIIDKISGIPVLPMMKFGVFVRIF